MIVPRFLLLAEVAMSCETSSCAESADRLRNGKESETSVVCGRDILDLHHDASKHFDDAQMAAWRFHSLCWDSASLESLVSSRVVENVAREDRDHDHMMTSCSIIEMIGY